MTFIDIIIDPFLVSRADYRDVGFTYLINWGWEISTIHCTWNTEDGNTDFQRNRHLEKRTQEWIMC